MSNDRHVLAAGLFAVAGLVAAAPAGAEGDWYTAVMGSYVDPDTDRRLDDGFGLALVAGTPLSGGASGELNLFAHQADLQAGTDDVQVFGVGGDVLFHGEAGFVQPFLLAGVGVTRESASAGDDTAPFGNVGLGFMAGRTAAMPFGLRAEVRFYIVDVDTLPQEEHAARDVRVNVGMVFGGAAKPVKVAAQPPPPTAPPPSMEPPRDSDRDGVMDGTDRCPGTAPGVTVDSTGCAVIEKVVLKGVNFASGSATLKPAAYETLRSVASAMKANEEIEVRIDGFTDSVGDDAKNLALSERRAQSVKNFLMKEGIAAERLTVKGNGEANPVDTNDTPEGRANNRRVEFNVD
jgi:OOP family OmpA-OmpF porin